MGRDGETQIDLDRLLPARLRRGAGQPGRRPGRVAASQPAATPNDLSDAGPTCSPRSPAAAPLVRSIVDDLHDATA
jgi:hypothetical protein